MKKRKKIIENDRQRRRAHVLRARSVRPREVLKDIAIGLAEQKIFASSMCYSEAELKSCFPVLMFAGPKVQRDIAFKLGRGGFLFESYSKALPRGVNGLPMFMSAQVVNSVERRIIDGYVEKLVKAKEEL